MILQQLNVNLRLFKFIEIIYTSISDDNYFKLLKMLENAGKCLKKMVFVLSKLCEWPKSRYYVVNACFFTSSGIIQSKAVSIHDLSMEKQMLVAVFQSFFLGQPIKE